MRFLHFAIPRPNHFAFSCNRNSSLLRYRLAGGSSKRAAVANDKKREQIQLPGELKPELTRKHAALIMDGSRRWAIHCSKSSVEEIANLNEKKSDDVRTAFLGVYSVLKSELLNDPTFEWTVDCRQWVEQMLDYNVPGGKLNRGLSVVDSYKLLNEGKDLSEGEVFLASVLGWCVEWLQACFLVHDDIMDNSHFRRGKPCWFRVPKVGMIAVNDGVLLRSHIHRILKKHFREKPYYVHLLDLFNEVEFQTVSGQMMDLTATIEGEKDLSKYSLHLYRRIAQYKTAYYSFYLPVACALLMAGENLGDHANVKDVLIDMGIYFQVLDDYQDCFGDPEKIGKIGTDIEDFKCSWLVVKALELCNDEQKKILHEHYGKADCVDVEKVKGVYNDIDLRGAFAAYERENYDKLKSHVEAHPSKAVQAIWAIYARYM